MQLIRRTRQTRAAAVAGETTDGVNSLVYVLGIGFMIYVGLEYVLPALFGATAKTKSAYQRLRTPRPESPTYYNPSESTFRVVG